MANAKRKKELTERLMVLQQAAREKGLAVIVLFEGWDASGKGEAISEVIQGLDPRGYKVYAPRGREGEEARYPTLARYWRETPARGTFAIWDQGWYADATEAALERVQGADEEPELLRAIRDLESQLLADGALILKFFLDISKKEQKKRFEALMDSPDTRWRVTASDRRRHRRYDAYRAYYKKLRNQTDWPGAKWRVIEADDRSEAARKVLETLISSLEEALARVESGRPVEYEPPEPLPVLPVKQLSDYEVDRTLDRDYKKALASAQAQLGALHNRLYRERIPVILCFEGWDAAGKGGAIKRLSQCLDPRGFEVIPISAPDAEEKRRHYLWRFYTRLPKDGHIALFDRSWYGRVLVERVEGFCTQDEWTRAYDEINRFEKSLCAWGAVVIKFFLHIDPDEQLTRFHARQSNPEKRWKITDEDWRNREKRPEYEKAVEEMLEKTSTEWAPWVIVEANDKQYARVKALETVLAAIQARLDRT